MCVLFDEFSTQVSLDGNVSTSTLQFTPLRHDNGKSVVCRASNELVKRSTKEITMKLNVCCKYIYYISMHFGLNLVKCTIY